MSTRLVNCVQMKINCLTLPYKMQKTVSTYRVTFLHQSFFAFEIIDLTTELDDGSRVGRRQLSLEISK